MEEEGVVVVAEGLLHLELLTPVVLQQLCCVELFELLKVL